MGREYEPVNLVGVLSSHLSSHSEADFSTLSLHKLEYTFHGVGCPGDSVMTCWRFLLNMCIAVWVQIQNGP
jgi:hypothetical protein